MSAEETYTIHEVDEIVIERTEGLRQSMQMWIDFHYNRRAALEAQMTSVAYFLEATVRRHKRGALSPGEYTMRLTDSAEILRAAIEGNDPKPISFEQDGPDKAPVED